jgi:hypothetical protein
MDQTLRRLTALPVHAYCGRPGAVAASVVTGIDPTEEAPRQVREHAGLRSPVACEYSLDER